MSWYSLAYLSTELLAYTNDGMLIDTPPRISNSTAFKWLALAVVTLAFAGFFGVQYWLYTEDADVAYNYETCDKPLLEFVAGSLIMTIAMLTLILPMCCFASCQDEGIADFFRMFSLAFGVASAGLTIAGCIWVATVNDECSEKSPNLYNLSLYLSVANVVALALHCTCHVAPLLLATCSSRVDTCMSTNASRSFLPFFFIRLET